MTNFITFAGFGSTIFSPEGLFYHFHNGDKTSKKPLISSPFENAITEGRQRKARVGRPTGNHIGEAVTNVHGRRGVAVVKQKIKIGPALRAA
jgi:hypothetical protein